MSAPGIGRRAAHPDREPAGRAGPALRHIRTTGRRLRAAIAWTRTPMMPRLSRRRAHLTAGLLATVMLSAGAGSAAAWVRPADPPPRPALTTLGPVSIHLPDDVGPWSVAPAASLDRLRTSQALGGAAVDGAWGAVAPGAIVVTVIKAVPRDAGIGEYLLPTLPDDGWAAWTGGIPHVVGSHVANGTRELTLAVVGDELVILCVSGPVSAFESGSLRDAFRTAVVGNDRDAAT